MRWIKDLHSSADNLPSLLRVESLRVDINWFNNTEVLDRIDLPFTHEFEFTVSGYECEESDSRDG